MTETPPPVHGPADVRVDVELDVQQPIRADERVTYNEPDTWTGPEYALGLVDEIVLHDATAHLEMLGDGAAYLIVRTARGREVSAQIRAVPATRAERADILRSRGDRLRDHLAMLLPWRWLAPWPRKVVWFVPVWRRPASAVREWWQDRRMAGCTLRVEIDYDDEAEGER